MATRLLLVLCVCGLLAAEDAGAPEPLALGWLNACPPGWTLFGSRCFIFHRAPKSFPDAENHCLSLGGNLASVHSAQENVFLSDLILRVSLSPPRTWIGGFDSIQEGRWMWSDGSSFDYSVWHKGEPNNNRGTEHCTEMYYRGRFWNDEVCSDKNPYICSRRL